MIYFTARHKKMFSGKSHYGSCFLVFIHWKYVDTVISSTHHPFCIVLHLLPKLACTQTLFYFSFRFFWKTSACAKGRRVRKRGERERARSVRKKKIMIWSSICKQSSKSNTFPYSLSSLYSDRRSNCLRVAFTIHFLIKTPQCSPIGPTWISHQHFFSRVTKPLSVYTLI